MMPQLEDGRLAFVSVGEDDALTPFGERLNVDEHRHREISFVTERCIQIALQVGLVELDVGSCIDREWG